MDERQFELVSTVGLTYSYQGSGGATGVTFIMRKKEIKKSLGSPKDIIYELVDLLNFDGVVL